MNDALTSEWLARTYALRIKCWLVLLVVVASFAMVMR